MLQKLNERIQGLIAWIVIVLIVITFTLFGLDYYLQSQRQVSDAVVEVNGQPLSKQAFEINYRRSRQQREGSKITAASEKILKKQVLENMILNEVTLQAAKHNGFDVSLEQANTAIVNIPQFQEGGHFSEARYQQALSAAMFTSESFQKEVRQGMLLNQQRFAFIGSAFVLANEINRFVKLYLQTRDYDYLIIPFAAFMKEAPPSQEAISQYYQAHKKEFIEPEKISIDYIRLSMKELRERLTISDEQIKHYYEENPDNFRTPAQWQVAHILFAIPKGASVEIQNQIQQKAESVYQLLQKNPEQFNTFLKSSDDKLSLINQGILPWMVAGQTEFSKNLSALKTPGQVSAPLRTTNGYEIFKLINYKPSTLKPFAEVQSLIKTQLLTELSQTKYAQALEKLSDLSYQSPDSLEPAASALNLKIEQSNAFSRAGGSELLTKKKEVINAAFSHEVLKLGNNSEPIQLNNDSVIVLRVNKHYPAMQLPLAKVQDFITKQLQIKQAEQLAKQLGDNLFAEQINSEAQKKLLTAHQLQWRQIERAARDSDKADPEINNLAFNLIRINTQQGIRLKNGDFALVYLRNIKDGQVNILDKEQQASIAQQIESSYGVMDYDLYVNSLLAQAKVKRHILR